MPSSRTGGRHAELRRDPFVEELREIGQRVLGHGEAGRHGVPAAVDQQARLPRGDHRRAEIDAACTERPDPLPSSPSMPMTKAGRP